MIEKKKPELKTVMKVLVVASLVTCLCTLVSLLFNLKAIIKIYDALYGPSSWGITYAHQMIKISAVLLCFEIVTSLFIFLVCLQVWKEENVGEIQKKT